MLERLIENNVLKPIDLFFAEIQSAVSESERIFFATLMAVSRAGSLCLDLDLLPRIDSSLEKEWIAHLVKGAQTACLSPYVFQEGRLFYLEKNFHYENQIATHIKRLFSPTIAYKSQKGGLTDEQHKAVETALSYTLSIIEGGPGTGKTFLITSLISSVEKKMRVILAAPTGKAAARLKIFNPETPCYTLHSLLKISSYSYRQTRSYFSAEILIIDECSMMDTQLFVQLLSSIQPGQRVIFLGDRNQLPPVESGSIFSDLNDQLPTAHLTQCLRSDRTDVLEIARSVLQGDLRFNPIPLSLDLIFNLASKYYPSSTNGVAQQFNIDQFCILSPLREGPFGVNSLNEQIYQFLIKDLKNGEKLPVPILITQTDYDYDIFNGEIGILWITKESIIEAYFPHSKRTISPALLPSYELSYVMTVHKSQGSEFDRVAVLLPKGSEIFGREVLYTAVTRAKLELILCGDFDTFQKTIQQRQQRQSGIKNRIKELYVS